MAYSPRTLERVERAPTTLGATLWHWAAKRQFSVVRIADFTGATRQTVYNWLHGIEVTYAYRKPVTKLIEVLQTSETADAAWRTCKKKKPRR